jgi:hypothetical protein
MDDNETREIIKLRQELAAVKHGLEKVLLTCSKLEEEKQEILEKWGEAADEMHKMKTERNYNQDDRYFKGAWGTLRYNIKNCTEQFFDKKSKISLFKAKDEFKRLSGDYDKYLMSDEHRPLLMQALVWHYLCDEIFGFGKPVSVNKWAGSGGTSFQSLSQNLRPGEQIRHATLDDQKCTDECSKLFVLIDKRLSSLESRNCKPFASLTRLQGQEGSDGEAACPKTSRDHEAVVGRLLDAFPELSADDR